VSNPGGFPGSDPGRLRGVGSGRLRGVGSVNGLLLSNSWSDDADFIEEDIWLVRCEGFQLHETSVRQSPKPLTGFDPAKPSRFRVSQNLVLPLSVSIARPGMQKSD
jgi:hypothetical protein